jgi:hypothetical protein
MKKIALFLLLASCATKSETVKKTESDSKLITELRDVYKAFFINHVLADQIDQIEFFFDDHFVSCSDSDKKKLINNYIKTCDSLRQALTIHDEVLKSHLNEYLASSSEVYRMIYKSTKKGNESDSMIYKKVGEDYQKAKNEYINYLRFTYPINNFVNMSEEQYWQRNDKKNYIKSPDYESYQRLKTSNPKEALTLLNKISEHTTDFQEHSIYQIELADQHVKNNEHETAIAKYKAILDQEKYSIYLFETWLKWRSAQQSIYGRSKTSHIANDEYNKMREKVALTILEHIRKNEQDEMAINEFLLMAAHDIIKRFGAYPYGNQNSIEYHQLFCERENG